MGEDESEADPFHFAMVNELGASQVRRVYLGFVSDMSERLRRLKLETMGRWSDDVVTLVVGVNAQPEIDMLREMGAFMCHQYGPLSMAYERVEIKPGDLMISMSEKRPAHVLDALEAYSECYTRKRHPKVKGAA
ncbi:hypothetical protein [Aliivibrio fischeri]|nr:hypothetical protein [Aliivibrio fischeri]